MHGPGREAARTEVGLVRTSNGRSTWLGEGGQITLALKARRRVRSRDGSHGEPLRDGMKAICREALSGSRGQDRLEEGTMAGREAIHSSAGWLTLCMRQETQKTLPFLMMVSLRTSRRQRHGALDQATHQRTRSKSFTPGKTSQPCIPRGRCSINKSHVNK